MPDDPLTQPARPASPAAGAGVRRATEPRVPPKRPDPRPMRLAFGVTSLAAAAAMTTAIIRPPAPAPAPVEITVQAEASQAPDPQPVVIRHVTRYVQLKAGETAPPGAKVVQKPDPSPRIVIVTLPAPASTPKSAPKRVVAVTRQSGTK